MSGIALVGPVILNAGITRSTGAAPLRTRPTSSVFIPPCASAAAKSLAKSVTDGADPMMLTCTVSAKWNGRTVRAIISRCSRVSRVQVSAVRSLSTSACSTKFCCRSVSASFSFADARSLASPASLSALPAFWRIKATSLRFIFRKALFLLADTTPTMNSPAIPRTTKATLSSFRRKSHALGFCGDRIDARRHASCSEVCSRITKYNSAATPTTTAIVETHNQTSHESAEAPRLDMVFSRIDMDLSKAEASMRRL